VNAVRVFDWALHSFIKTRVASENMTDIIPGSRKLTNFKSLDLIHSLPMVLTKSIWKNSLNRIQLPIGQPRELGSFLLAKQSVQLQSTITKQRN
jgi:hypothetical protein